ncbi:unnamed protein product, partial [Prorocentrum cordatum]
ASGLVAGQAVGPAAGRTFAAVSTRQGKDNCAEKGGGDNCGGLSEDSSTEKGGCDNCGRSPEEDPECANYKDMRYTVGSYKDIGAASARAGASAGSAGQDEHACFDHFRALFGKEFRGVSYFRGRVASAKGREFLPIETLAAEKALREAVDAEARGTLAAHALNFLARAGRYQRPAWFRASASLSREQRGVIGRLVESAGRVLNNSLQAVDPATARDDLEARRAGCGGGVASKKRGSVCDLAVPAWPVAGKAATLPVEDFVDGGFRDDLLDAQRRLPPRSEWPAVAPQSPARAGDAERREIAQVGIERGVVVEVNKDDGLRGGSGKLVLNGATGACKFNIVG